MAIVRQSTIGSFGKCSYQLKLGRDYGYRTSIVRVLGTAIHKGMEVYYNDRKDTGNVPKLTVKDYVEATIQEFDDEVGKAESMNWAFQNQTKYKDELILNREHSIMMLEQLIEMYHENKWYYPMDWEIRGVEDSFDILLPDGVHTAHGTMDLRMIDPRGQLICADFKTSKDFPTKSKWSAKETAQAAYYTWAGAVMEGVDPSAIRFFFDVLSWYPKKAGRGKEVDQTARFERFEESRTNEQVTATLKHAQIIGDLMDKDAYAPNTQGWWCSQNFCDYWNECEFGKVYANSSLN